MLREPATAALHHLRIVLTRENWRELALALGIDKLLKLVQNKSVVVLSQFELLYGDLVSLLAAVLRFPAVPSGDLTRGDEFVPAAIDPVLDAILNG